MTPQEKAKELFTRFRDKLWDTGSYAGKVGNQAKKCALICCDEIIEDYHLTLQQYDETNRETIDNAITYWWQTKAEIEKL